MPYVHFTGEDRLYVGPVDNNGYRRTSHGEDVMIGDDFSLAHKKLTGNIGIGYMTQSYQDSRFSTAHTFAFKGRLNWRPTDKTKASLYTDKSFYPTTLAGASSELYSGVGAFVEHKLTPVLSLNLRGIYDHSDFRGISRKDNDYDTSVGLSYALSPHTYLATDLRNEKRFSNAAGASFNRNEIFVQLGVYY